MVVDHFDTSRAAFVVGVANIAAFSAALSLIHIGRAPLWRDEAVTFSVAHRSFGDMLQVLVHREGNMGLYFIATHLWLKFGTSEAWLRSLSVLFAALSVVATGLTVERILGRRAALIAALLLGTNPFFLTYAREARAYSLVLLLTACASYCFVRVWQDDDGRWRTAYVICLTLAAYAHMLAILAIAGHLAALLISRRWTRRWTMTYGAVALTIAPLAVYALLNDRGQTAWIERPDFGTLQDFTHVLIGNNLWLLFCAGLIGGAMVRAVRTRRGADRVLVASGVAAFAGPIIVVFAVSQLKPLFVDKYMIFVLPALILVLAYGIVRAPGGLSVAVLLTLALAAHWVRVDGDILSQPVRQEDLRSAAVHVAEHGRAEDALLYVPSWSRTGFEHYARQVGVAPRDVALAPGGEPSQIDDIFARELAPEQIEAKLGDVRRVWVVGYGENGWPVTPEPAEAVRAAHLQRADWIRRDSKTFGAFEVDLYEVRS